MGDLCLGAACCTGRPGTMCERLAERASSLHTEVHTEVSSFTPEARIMGNDRETAPRTPEQMAARTQMERVTVNLTPRASEALREAVELSKDSKTDTINRALQVYAFVLRSLEGE